MRKPILIALLAALFTGCESGHGVTIEVDSARIVKGVTIAHTADEYHRANGQYKVTTMIKHTGHDRLKSLQLNAFCFNETGKKIAESIGGPDTEIMPGDSAIVSTDWVFPTPESLPYKVVLTVSN
jgi:hypothetical protein